MNKPKPINEIKQEIAAGKLDAALSRIYVKDTESLEPYKARILRLMAGYEDVFGTDDAAPAAIFSAPGRTELGGNHTDHQGGLVLTGAVDLDAIACAAPNGTDTVNIWSEGFGMTTLSCVDLEPREEEKNHTAAIVRGMLAGVAKAGCPVAGFDAYVVSDVPGGSGLSSSACFEILIGTIADGLFGDGIDPVELAKIGQYAENVYFGKPSGLLDQMGCSIGGIVNIDFCDRQEPAVRRVDFDFAKTGYALCIIDTGGDHAGLTDCYAAIPEEMRAVARVFGKERLSEVEEKSFLAAIPEVRRKAGDRAVQRAMHYYADCRRVVEQTAALERGDFPAYLKLVRESGDSSFKYLQNVDTYRDPANQPVALALAIAERLLAAKGAVRVHGGGFAGTIQAYVSKEELAAFKEGMDRIFGEGACRVTSIRPVGGCRVI